jgi:methionyl-tRNA formyltransferase
LWVAAGSGTLSLEEVQLENRNRLAGGAFVGGARLKSGERFQATQE